MATYPLKFFERNGIVYPVVSVPCAFAIGNNQAIVTGTTGYIVRVVGWHGQSNGAAQGTFIFKSASGGTVLTSAKYLPPNTNEPWCVPLDDSGYCETVSGQGLYADVTAAAINLDVFVVKYKV